MSIAAALALAQTGYGIYQNIKGNRLAREAERPTYEIPEASRRAMFTAEMRSMQGLPSEVKSEMLKQMDRSRMSSLAQINERRGGLGAISQINQQQQDAMSQIAAADIQQREQNIAAMQQQRGAMAEQQQRQWQWDKAQKYQEQAAAASALQGAGLQNIAGGVKTMGMMAMENQDNLKSLFGGGMSKNRKAYQKYSEDFVNQQERVNLTTQQTEYQDYVSGFTAPEDDPDATALGFEDWQAEQGYDYADPMSFREYKKVHNLGFANKLKNIIQKVKDKRQESIDKSPEKNQGLKNLINNITQSLKTNQQSQSETEQKNIQAQNIDVNENQSTRTEMYSEREAKIRKEGGYDYNPNLDPANVESQTQEGEGDAVTKDAKPNPIETLLRNIFGPKKTEKTKETQETQETEGAEVQTEKDKEELAIQSAYNDYTNNLAEGDTPMSYPAFRMQYLNEKSRIAQEEGGGTTPGTEYIVDPITGQKKSTVPVLSEEELIRQNDVSLKEAQNGEKTSLLDTPEEHTVNEQQEITEGTLESELQKSAQTLIQNNPGLDLNNNGILDFIETEAGEIQVTQDMIDNGYTGEGVYIEPGSNQGDEFNVSDMYYQRYYEGDFQNGVLTNGTMTTVGMHEGEMGLWQFDGEWNEDGTKLKEGTITLPDGTVYEGVFDGTGAVTKTSPDGTVTNGVMDYDNNTDILGDVNTPSNLEQFNSAFKSTDQVNQQQVDGETNILQKPKRTDFPLNPDAPSKGKVNPDTKGISYNQALENYNKQQQQIQEQEQQDDEINILQQEEEADTGSLSENVKTQKEKNLQEYNDRVQSNLEYHENESSEDIANSLYEDTNGRINDDGTVTVYGFKTGEGTHEYEVTDYPENIFDTPGRNWDDRILGSKQGKTFKTSEGRKKIYKYGTVESTRNDDGTTTDIITITSKNHPLYGKTYTRTHKENPDYETKKPIDDLNYLFSHYSMEDGDKVTAERWGIGEFEGELRWDPLINTRIEDAIENGYFKWDDGTSLTAEEKANLLVLFRNIENRYSSWSISETEETSNTGEIESEDTGYNPLNDPNLMAAGGGLPPGDYGQSVDASTDPVKSSDKAVKVKEKIKDISSPEFIWSEEVGESTEPGTVGFVVKNINEAMISLEDMSSDVFGGENFETVRSKLFQNVFTNYETTDEGKEKELIMKELKKILPESQWDNIVASMQMPEIQIEVLNEFGLSNATSDKPGTMGYMNKQVQDYVSSVSNINPNINLTVSQVKRLKSRVFSDISDWIGKENKNISDKEIKSIITKNMNMLLGQNWEQKGK